MWADTIFNNFGPGDTYQSTGPQIYFQNTYTEFTVPGGPQAWAIHEIDVVLTNPLLPLDFAAADLWLNASLVYGPNSLHIAGQHMGSATASFGTGQFGATGTGPVVKLTTGGPLLASPGDRVLFDVFVSPGMMNLGHSKSDWEVVTWNLNSIGDVGPFTQDCWTDALSDQSRPAFRVFADPVPEPASIALLATTLGGLALSRRARTKVMALFSGTRKDV